MMGMHGGGWGLHLLLGGCRGSATEYQGRPAARMSLVCHQTACGLAHHRVLACRNPLALTNLASDASRSRPSLRWQLKRSESFTIMVT